LTLCRIVARALQHVVRVTVITDLGRETHQGLVTEIQTHLGLEAEVAHVSKVSMLNCMSYTCKGCVSETETEKETETETERERAYIVAHLHELVA
jgi:hypothetical protein